MAPLANSAPQRATVRFQKWLHLPPPIQVLLFHDQNYGIHYEYTIPVNHTAENRSEPEKPQDSPFLWTHSGWEECSVQCGGGERRGRGAGSGGGAQPQRGGASPRDRLATQPVLPRKRNHGTLQISVQNACAESSRLLRVGAVPTLGSPTLVCGGGLAPVRLRHRDPGKEQRRPSHQKVLLPPNTLFALCHSDPSTGCGGRAGPPSSVEHVQR